MKIYSAVLYILAASLLFPLIGAETQIALPNGDFSKIKADATPANWGISRQGKPLSVSVKDKVLTISATQKTAWPSVFISLPVAKLPVPKQGEKCVLTLSYQQKTEGLSGVSYGTIELADKQYRRLRHRDGQSPTRNADWSQRSTILEYTKLPANCERVILHFFLGQATGKTHIRNVRFSARIEPVDIPVAKSSGNLLRNGSFEQVNADGKPLNWRVWQSGGAAAEITILKDDAYDGKNLICFRNKSNFSPGIYGAIMQYVKASPNVRYRLSFYARCQGAHQMRIYTGKGWCKRIDNFHRIPSQWKKYAYYFTFKPNEIEKGLVPVVFATDGVTAGTEIDDIQFCKADEPEEQGIKVSQNDLRARRIFELSRFSGDAKKLRNLPGNLPKIHFPLDDYRFIDNPGLLLPGTPLFKAERLPKPEDFSADAAVAYDDQGLWFFFHVNDNKRFVVDSGPKSWTADSIQIRLCQQPDGDGKIKQSDIGINLYAGKQGVKVFEFIRNRYLTAQEVQPYYIEEGKGYFAALHLKKTLLDKTNFKDGVFSFNLILNDGDAPGDRKIMVLESGQHDFASDRYNWIGLLPGNVRIEARPSSASEFAGRLYLRGLDKPVPWNMNWQIRSQNGKVLSGTIQHIKACTKKECILLDVRFPLAALPDGAYQVSFFDGKKLLLTASGKKSDLQKELANAHAALLKQFQNWQKRYPKDKKDAYQALMENVLQDQLRKLSRDLARVSKEPKEKDFLLERASCMCKELQTLLKKAEKLAARKQPVETWQMTGTPVFGKDHWFSAPCTSSSGKKAIRPIFWAGYGHNASRLYRDLDEIARANGKIIQIEVGPAHVLKGIDKNGKYIVSSKDFHILVGRVLPEAKKRGIKVVLLLSPHYEPRWWINQHPEVKAGHGFMHYDALHPEAYKLLNAYFDVVLPMIANNPARDVIISICLTNEGIYSGSLSSAFQRKLYAEYLQKEYKNIAGYNAAHRTNYGSFAEVVTAAQKSQDLQALAEYDRFKQFAYAEWTKYLRDKVRKFFPNIPTQVKTMIDVAIQPGSERLGTDPELLAGVTEINGNDNSFSQSGRWTSNYVPLTRCCDMQRSFNGYTIMDTEAHIYTEDFVPLNPKHVYSGVLLHMLYGTSGIVSWNWEYAVNSKEPCTRGNVACHPEGVYEQGRAALDAMRLAPEFKAFALAPAQTALLFSESSFLRNADSSYASSMEEIYEELSFRSLPMTYLSESDLAKGNFKQVKVLILPKAKFIPEAAFKGIRRFLDKGGKVLAVGDCAKYDFHGNPLPSEPRIKKFSGTQLPADDLTKEIMSAIGGLPAFLLADNGKALEGVLSRCAVCRDGRVFLLAVNFRKQNVPVNLQMKPGKNAVDLLSGKKYAKRFILEPQEPVLLEIR